MPRRCSIPGCKTRHTQGYKLLCYPKDPVRRAAWIQSVKNVGLEPSNMHFVCELHFGPTQWEKVRVDGTRKLKWQGVPDTFDTEKADVSSSASATESSLSDSCTELKNSKFPPNIFKKVMKLDSCDGQNFETKTLIRGMENSAISRVKNTSDSVNTPIEFPLLKSSSLSPVESNDLLSSSSDIVIPLKNNEHYVVVRLPQTQYHSSLMEDICDVRSFLKRNECAYEERLVKSLAELVKKHQLLDQKLERADEALKENATLKAKLRSFEAVLIENFRMKEKLRMYKIKEVQNSALLEKVHYYEQAVKTVTAREEKSEIALPLNESDKVSCGGSNDSDVTPVKRVSPFVAFSNPNQDSDRNQHTFVSLDDQL